MAQLLCIGQNLINSVVERKLYPTVGAAAARQPVDSIVGISEDSHQYSPTEEYLFNIYQISNLIKTEVKNALPYVLAITKGYYYLNKWYVENITTKEMRENATQDIEMWKDSDGEWYELNSEPFHEICIANLTQQQKDDLADIAISNQNKIDILSLVQNNIRIEPDNYLNKLKNVRE